MKPPPHMSEEEEPTDVLEEEEDPPSVEKEEQCDIPSTSLPSHPMKPHPSAREEERCGGS
jgi:hypothetical protein